jgi:hypothetical protein
MLEFAKQRKLHRKCAGAEWMRPAVYISSNGQQKDFFNLETARFGSWRVTFSHFGGRAKTGRSSRDWLSAVTRGPGNSVLPTTQYARPLSAGAPKVHSEFTATTPAPDWQWADPITGDPIEAPVRRGLTGIE